MSAAAPRPALGSDERLAVRRVMAALRLALMPIVLAGQRILPHPLVGNHGFDLTLALAAIYAAIVLVDVTRGRRPRISTELTVVLDLVMFSALAFNSGSAFPDLRGAFLVLPLGGGLLLGPRRTGVVAIAAAAAFVLVALLHPARWHSPLPVTLVHAGYILWTGAASVAISAILSRRWRRILELGAAGERLAGQLLEVEDNARRRVCDALHDHAIQNVLAARQELVDIRAGEPAALERAEYALTLALQQLRGVIRELHPYLLDHLGLPAALEAMAAEHARRGGFRAQVAVDPAASGERDELLALVAGELLSNAVKHAGATAVSVRVERLPGAVALQVSDDGCGFGPEQQAAALRAGHVGLAAARERVEAFGGGFHIRSVPGGGSELTCLVPLASSLD